MIDARAKNPIIVIRRTAALGLAWWCAAAAVASVAQEAPQSLRLRWQPGQVHTFETTTETSTDLRALGRKTDHKMKVKQVTQVAVSAGAGGRKEAKVTFKSISGDVQDEGKTQTFDSAKPEAAPAEVRDSLVRSTGTSFVLVYGPDDNFLTVRDAGTMVRADDGNPSLAGLAEAEQVAELYRRSLEMGLPKMKVKAGDRWTAEEMVNFPSAGMVKSEMRARFDAVVDYNGEPHAKITFEGDLIPNPGKGAGASAVKLAPGCKTYGQLLYHLRDGMMTFAAFRADLRLDVGGKTLPVRQQVATKLTETQVKAGKEE